MFTISLLSAEKKIKSPVLGFTALTMSLISSSLKNLLIGEDIPDGRSSTLSTLKYASPLAP